MQAVVRPAWPLIVFDARGRADHRGGGGLESRLKVNEAKSAVARPEERKFLGFSISNDGSERRIAPKALDKFKGRIRDMTRRTRGFSLQQLIKELKPYIVGWRGYFGFCQTPRVLTNFEAWIRRRLRLYLWRQWRTRQNRFAELRRRGVAKFAAAVAAASPTGACPDIRRSNKPYATTISSRSVFPESLRLPQPNSVEPPLVRTRMPGGVGGVASRGVPLSRSCANSDHSPTTCPTGHSIVPVRKAKSLGSRRHPTASSARCFSADGRDDPSPKIWRRPPLFLVSRSESGHRCVTRR